jgi:hypothetical protein
VEELRNERDPQRRQQLASQLANALMQSGAGTTMAEGTVLVPNTQATASLGQTPNPANPQAFRNQHLQEMTGAIATALETLATNGNIRSMNVEVHPLDPTGRRPDGRMIITRERADGTIEVFEAKYREYAPGRFALEVLGPKLCVRTADRRLEPGRGCHEPYPYAFRTQTGRITDGPPAVNNARDERPSSSGDSNQIGVTWTQTWVDRNGQRTNENIGNRDVPRPTEGGESGGVLQTAGEALGDFTRWIGNVVQAPFIQGTAYVAGETNNPRHRKLEIINDANRGVYGVGNVNAMIRERIERLRNSNNPNDRRVAEDYDEEQRTLGVQALDRLMPPGAYTYQQQGDLNQISPNILNNAEQTMNHSTPFGLIATEERGRGNYGWGTAAQVFDITSTALGFAGLFGMFGGIASWLAASSTPWIAAFGSALSILGTGTGLGMLGIGIYDTWNAGWDLYYGWKSGDYARFSEALGRLIGNAALAWPVVSFTRWMWRTFRGQQPPATQPSTGQPAEQPNIQYRNRRTGEIITPEQAANLPPGDVVAQRIPGTSGPPVPPVPVEGTPSGAPIGTPAPSGGRVGGGGAQGSAPADVLVPTTPRTTITTGPATGDVTIRQLRPGETIVINPDGVGPSISYPHVEGGRPQIGNQPLQPNQTVSIETNTPLGIATVDVTLNPNGSITLRSNRGVNSVFIQHPAQPGGAPVPAPRASSSSAQPSAGQAASPAPGSAFEPFFDLIRSDQNRARLETFLLQQRLDHARRAQNQQGWMDWLRELFTGRRQREIQELERQIAERQQELGRLQETEQNYRRQQQEAIERHQRRQEELRRQEEEAQRRQREVAQRLEQTRQDMERIGGTSQIPSPAEILRQPHQQAQDAEPARPPGSGSSTSGVPVQPPAQPAGAATPPPSGTQGPPSTVNVQQPQPNLRAQIDALQRRIDAMNQQLRHLSEEAGRPLRGQVERWRQEKARLEQQLPPDQAPPPARPAGNQPLPDGMAQIESARLLLEQDPLVGTGGLSNAESAMATLARLQEGARQGNRNAQSLIALVEAYVQDLARIEARR